MLDACASGDGLGRKAILAFAYVAEKRVYDVCRGLEGAADHSVTVSD